jgi:hypothetical protein
MNNLFNAFFFFFVSINSFAQNNERIIGIYCGSLNRGLSCISFNNDKVAYCVDISLVGDINFVSHHHYFVVGDTIKINDYMDYYWRNDTIYWFNAGNKAILKGGFKKADDKIIVRINKKYSNILKSYNLCIKDKLIKPIIDR